MSITISTAKPTASAQQRREAGQEQAAEGVARGDQRCVPRPMSCMMPFIFCAPWLTPIANTRNGTRIEYGSSSKPSSATRPSCHTTATSEQATTSAVLRTQRV